MKYFISKQEKKEIKMYLILEEFSLEQMNKNLILKWVDQMRSKYPKVKKVI